MIYNKNSLSFAVKKETLLFRKRLFIYSNSISIKASLLIGASFLEFRCPYVIDKAEAIELAVNHAAEEIGFVIQFMDVKGVDIFLKVRNLSDVNFGEVASFAVVEVMRQNF